MQSMKYIVEIATADHETRPGCKGQTSNDDNWTGLTYGESAEDVLADLIESANDENFTIVNSWLRLKINGVVQIQ